MWNPDIRYQYPWAAMEYPLDVKKILWFIQKAGEILFWLTRGGAEYAM